MSRRQRARALLVALVVTAIALVPSAAAWADDEEPTYTVSGIFTTNLTSPFKADYSAVNAWDHDGDYVNGVLLGPDGSYSLDLPEGTYNFQFTAYAEDGIDRYQIPSVHTTRRDVQVSDDMVLNVFDDEPALTVHLVDPQGDPISGHVSLSCQLTVDDWPVRGDQDDPYEVVRRMDDFAEGTGDLVVHGFDVAKNPEHPEWRDGCELVVYPARGTYRYIDVDLSASEPNEMTVTVPDPVTVRGHISTPDGSTFGAFVDAVDAEGRQLRSAEQFVTDGDYTMLLSPGTYTLDFSVSSAEETRTQSMRLRKRGVVVAAGQDMTVDASIDTVPVKVNLVDVNGDPVGGGAEITCEESQPERHAVPGQSAGLPGVRDRAGHSGRGACVGGVADVPPGVDRRRGWRRSVLVLREPGDLGRRPARRVHPHRSRRSAVRRRVPRQQRP